MDVYINDVAAFLPGEPVTNEQMEQLLGQIGKLKSRTRRLVLRNNGIKTRHYALNPATGKLTHTNAQMVAEAIRKLRPGGDFDLDSIELLSCGTASPDLLMPGHASMVHGELEISPTEIVSTTGICMAGMSAMKYAYMSILSGQSTNAVATGSELSSSFLRAAWFGNDYAGTDEEELKNNPLLAFESDFLRWMLSDGAGAAYLSPTPSIDRLSLKIEWIDSASYAGELPLCMYAGGVKDEEGNLKVWRDYDSPAEALDAGAHLVKQDVKLLNGQIVEVAVERALARIVEEKKLDLSTIDWFLPHYSSEYFKPLLMRKMEEQGLMIAPEKWFTNLGTKGNTGAASIYIILEELLHSGRLAKGDRLLLFIPESGRFSMCYMLLTAL